MGADQSTVQKIPKEMPAPDVDATLYYFEGRGVADQIRWMLAAGGISFVQKSVTSREIFLQMVESKQLPFGQLPLLQIDGLEIVQTQAIIRYIARRSHLCGSSALDECKCDMIAECVKDALGGVIQIPFKKRNAAHKDSNTNQDSATQPTQRTEDQDLVVSQLGQDWCTKYAMKFEAILAANKALCNRTDGVVFCVGASITYADILLVHCFTWYVEECGADITKDTPLLLELQHYLLTSTPLLTSFLQSSNYYPMGDNHYCEQVSRVLGRHI